LASSSRSLMRALVVQLEVLHFVGILTAANLAIDELSNLDVRLMVRVGIVLSSTSHYLRWQKVAVENIVDLLNAA
jgi:hypothetical protein